MKDVRLIKQNQLYHRVADQVIEIKSRRCGPMIRFHPKESLPSCSA